MRIENLLARKDKAMKGIVFTEFLQLVEEKFGYEMVDKLLLAAKTEHGGAYTAVGTYDHQELIQLVVKLSEEVNIDTPELVKTFGSYLFKKFSVSYPGIFGSEQNNTFDFLQRVEEHIHVEVRKLYPDAELPTFKYNKLNDDTLEVIYQSSRPFADLCEGLISECIVHFEEKISVQREDLADDGTSAKFTLLKQSAGFASA